MDENRIALRRRVIDWRSEFQDLAKPLIQKPKPLLPPKPPALKFDWEKIKLPKAKTEPETTVQEEKKEREEDTDPPK